MRPYTTEIIDSIIWSLQTYVKPELQSPFADSVLMTVENLLRHIRIREESEATLLLEDKRELEAVLEKLHANLNGHDGLSKLLGNELEDIQLRLRETRIEQDGIPSVGDLNEHSEVLRKILDELLKALSALRHDYATDETYRNCRQLIRDYIAHSLERDGQLITPAFTGGRR
ncbi:MAG: hypothetical protein HN416_08200 [Nitrospina sp.]|jgi:hypothetical protein|nr:hypothetical protein [Nitrospina sp.]